MGALPRNRAGGQAAAAERRTGGSRAGLAPLPRQGNLWFTDAAGSAIGRITTTGQITEFPLPTSCGSSSGCAPEGITTGPDGTLWFTERAGNNIGRITPAGQITEFPILTASSLPEGITTGPDGALWFAEFNVGNIGRITTGGSITAFTLPSTCQNKFGCTPLSITAGPAHNSDVWFTEFRGAKIGRITTK